MTATADLNPRVLQALLLLGGAAVGLLSGFDPRFAVAAALGVAFMVMVLGDRRIGLYLFAVVAFLDVLPAFGGPLFSVVKILGLLLAASWIAAAASRGEGEGGLAAASPLLAYVLAILIAYAALSLTWSEMPDQGLGALGRYALNAVLLLIVVDTLRRRRECVGLVTAYVVGATGSALYGMLFTSEDQISDPVGRVSGTIGDANELSAVLVAGFALAVGLALAARTSPVLRVAAWVGAAICLTGSFLTLSRGGFVALAVVLAAGVVFGGRWRVGAAVVGVLVALGGAGYFAMIAPHEALGRLTAADGGTGRTDIWTVGWRMVEDQPVLGVGVGNFQSASIHYLLEPGGIERDEFIVDRPRVAHNTYLHVLAELGLVGLVMFALVLFLPLRCSLRAARTFASRGERGMEAVSRGALVALIGLLVADFFISEQFSKQLWLLLGVGPSLLAVARSSRPSEAPDAVERVAYRRDAEALPA